MVTNEFFPKLFSPARIAKIKLKNRLVMLPMGTSYASISGEVTYRTIDHFVERAKGGVGLVQLGNVSVEGRIALNQLVLDSDLFLAGHFELVEAIHASGARVCIQLNHPGRQKYPVTLEGQQPVSSSPLRTRHMGEFYPSARALEKGEIYQVIEKFAQAAIRAKKVGYDMVELHGAHGYLINQFISPFMNKRVDEFGGSLENRLRFPLELIRRVKESVGDGYPIGMRISAEEFVEGGITIKDSPEIAKRIADTGLAYISVSAGIYESAAKSRDTMRQVEGWKAYLWDAVKKEVSIPVIGGGGLKTPAFCEKVLDEEKADLIGLARPLLADPEWPNKSRQGRTEDIRPCISCFECMTPSAAGRQGVRRCTVNASVGREREFAKVDQAEIRKKVMVVGGGPAGMEAARISALRGHEVTLYEKAPKLGGNLPIASAAPGKEKILWIKDYLVNQLEKLNVRIVLNTEVTPSLIEKTSPDAVIMATGSTSFASEIPGDDQKKTVNAWDVLAGKVKIEGERVVVIGGSMVGCETAEYLAERGNQVTIIKIRPGAAAMDMQAIHRMILLENLETFRVSVWSNQEVVRISEEGVLTRDKKSDEERMIGADRVILALGAKPERALADSFEGKDLELYCIGDCESPRIIKEAIYEGSMVGRKL
ncbi:MAG: FAD-binding protein [Desulfobacteraceae bacterium]|nr:MAG: FAD-binding protein [Desulfobacteraceae bacterium]